MLNRNEPACHCVPARAYEELMDLVADLELGRIPIFLVKSTGARLLDRLFDAIEPWLDGGADPIVALGDILLAEEACGVTLEVEGGLDLNWRRLSAAGFQPAFRCIGSHEPYDPRQVLKRLPRKGDAKGFR